MKKVVLILGLLLPAAQLASAADMLVGDASAGERKAAGCVACHGQGGNSAVAQFPKLAGLGEKYLLQQMQAIRDGVRPVAVMAGQVDNMSDQDLADIAAYFDAQDRTREKAKDDQELLALGEKVYRAGIAERNVAACTACHSPNGNGNGPAGFPALAGQHADYIKAQLQAYRTGYQQPGEGRYTDGDSKIMRTNAFGLSDLEIEAVATYASGLQ
jgi:cytochrome c553